MLQKDFNDKDLESDLETLNITIFFKRNFFNADFASLSSWVSGKSNTGDPGVTPTAGVLEIMTLGGPGFSGSICVGSSWYEFTPSISSQYPRLKIRLLAKRVVPLSLR